MVLRIGVIGCGAAGLCAGRHMIYSPELYDFVIFEQTSAVGGTWNYTEMTGMDEFNLPIHSSMYKNLRTNIPKEIMGFPDFPFPECGKSFTHHTQVLSYLKEYASFHGLYRKIKFRSHVESVSPEELPGKKRIWKVTVRDLEANIVKEYEFDSLIICNGHFSVPNIPLIENIEAYKGIKSHSHSYRQPEVYKDKTVVVLGAGSSGMDISIEISPYAKKVYLSHNLAHKHSCKLPGNIIQKPGIKAATEDGFVFLDDSRVTADVLMHCTESLMGIGSGEDRWTDTEEAEFSKAEKLLKTCESMKKILSGCSDIFFRDSKSMLANDWERYVYSFPFLTEACKIKVEGNRVMPLYKHLIHMDFPELCFIGLPFTVLPFPFFHYQSQYFLKTLNKSVQLPDRKAMQEEAEKDYRKRIVDMKMPPKHAHKMGPLQWEYFEDLGNIISIGGLPPVHKMVYDIVEGERKKNVMFYRREDFKLLSGEEYVRTMPEP